MTRTVTANATVTTQRTVTTTSTPPSFSRTYAREHSGVVRIETVSCSDAGIGTGFLLSPTLIATVDHVVAGAAVVSLIDGTQRTTGTVVGADAAHDLALVRADRALSGYTFRFAATAPAVGDQVGAIGFPIGGPITFTRGDVSGVDRDIDVEGTARSGLLQTDAAINPGNSGGPLITPTGTVDGLIDAASVDANAIGYAIPSSQAAPAMARWRSDPRPVPAASCPNPLGPKQNAPAAPTPSGQGVPATAATGIEAAFTTYFDGIDAGDYGAAWDVLSPRLQAAASEQAFADGDATTYDSGITVLAAREIDSTRASVALSFTSLQTAAKGPGGDTCDVWTIDYTMVESADGTWRIDATAPYHDAPLHTPC